MLNTIELVTAGIFITANTQCDFFGKENFGLWILLQRRVTFLIIDECFQENGLWLILKVDEGNNLVFATLEINIF